MDDAHLHDAARQLACTSWMVGATLDSGVVEAHDEGSMSTPCKPTGLNFSNALLRTAFKIVRIRHLGARAIEHRAAMAMTSLWVLCARMCSQPTGSALGCGQCQRRYTAF